MAASGHFGSPICAKNNRVLPLCVINGCAKYEVDRWIYDRWIYDRWIQLEMPQVCLTFLFKMAARGHFVFPIDATNHRVLVIWDLNGYGEYEFDRRICDKVMACTSVGGGDGGGGATKNIISPTFSNFGDINMHYVIRIVLAYSITSEKKIFWLFWLFWLCPFTQDLQCNTYFLLIKFLYFIM